MKPIELLRANNKRRRRVSPLKERRVIEVKYTRSLRAYIKQVEQDTLETFKNNGLTLDTRADDFAAAFRNLRAIHLGNPDQITTIVRAFTNESEETHKRRFFESLTKSFGVDIQTLIDDEGLTETLSASVEENVSLIKSIPEQYFEKVEQAVFRNLASGSTDGLLAEIQKIGDVTESRARLIARDQNSKLNSRLTKARQEALGVEEYRWVTAGDERVRKTHRDNNKQVFRWDSPPDETGHPGEDIQCRCIAQPII